MFKRSSQAHQTMDVESMGHNGGRLLSELERQMKRKNRQFYWPIIGCLILLVIFLLNVNHIMYQQNLQQIDSTAVLQEESQEVEEDVPSSVVETADEDQGFSDAEKVMVQPAKGRLFDGPVVPFKETGGKIRDIYLKRLEEMTASRCNIYPGPGNREQVCCLPKESVPMRSGENPAQSTFCMPGIVVAGAQKGGTTALHSYLMLYRQLIPAEKKEIHMFDADRAFSGFPNILKRMYRRNIRDEHELSSGLSYESTPSYLASTMACERMSMWLPPWTVVVVILRDPVKRFWSEYNMKMRRITNQDVTLLSVIENKDAILECLHRQNPFNAAGKTDLCWDKLFGLNGAIKGTPPKIWAVKKRLISISRQGRKNDAHDDDHDREKLKRPPRDDEFVEACIKNADELQTLEAKRDCFRRTGVLRESLPKIPDILDEEEDRLRPCMETPDYNIEYTDFTASTEALDQTSCKNVIKETWCPDCYQKQVGNLDQCVGSCIYHNRINYWTQGCKITSGDDGKFYYPPKKVKSGKHCNGPFCRCYPVAKNFADISRNFLWRGLYYYQIANCFRSIPRHQFVIIENEDLRNDVNGTLNYILQRAELPGYDFSRHSWKDASAAFDRRYPNFETITGWSADGSSSEKMPKDLEERLRKFYAKPNQHLFDLIGKTYDHWL